MLLEDESYLPFVAEERKGEKKKKRNYELLFGCSSEVPCASVLVKYFVPVFLVDV
jgi:hypothetical protein